MKLIFTLFLLIQLTKIQAQDSIQVIEKEMSFSKGMHNGFYVKIPQAKMKDVISDLKNDIREKNKSKLKETDGEYRLSKTIVPDFSNDSLIVYATIISMPPNVELSVFVTSDDTVFYSTKSNNIIAANVSSYIRNFALKEYKNAVNIELTSEQKKLKGLEEQLTDLENNNVKNEKKINANIRSIERTNDDIKSNLQMQDIKSETITQQQKVLATYTTSSDQKTTEEKKLKSLQKEKNKLKNENESLHLAAEDLESENKSLQKKIETNNNETIPAKKTEIEKQKEVISSVDKKLRAIK